MKTAMNVVNGSDGMSARNTYVLVGGSADWDARDISGCNCAIKITRRVASTLWLVVSFLLSISCSVPDGTSPRTTYDSTDRVHPHFQPFHNIVLPTECSDVITVDGMMIPLRFDVFPDGHGPAAGTFRCEPITFILVRPCTTLIGKLEFAVDRPFYIATTEMSQSQAGAIRNWRFVENGWMEHVESELFEIGSRYVNREALAAMASHYATNPNADVLDVVAPDAQFLVRYVLNGALPVICIDLARAADLLTKLSWEHKRFFRLPSLGEWHCALGSVNDPEIHELLDHANLDPGGIPLEARVQELLARIVAPSSGSGDYVDAPRHMLGNVREAIFLNERERAMFNSNRTIDPFLVAFHYTILAAGGSVFTPRDLVEELTDAYWLIIHQQHIQCTGVPAHGFDCGLRPAFDLPVGVIEMR